MALKRQLSLLELTLMGVGMILGAGIYVLVGIAGVQAGASLWLAFIVAGIISLLTGLSYAELASMYPQAGSSFNYVKKAFNNNSLAFTAGWLLIITGIIAATTVALGFAHYVNALSIPLELIYAAGLAIALGAFFNARGLHVAAKVNNVATLLEIAGLLIVLFIGFTMTSGLNVSFDMPLGLTGFFSAVVLAFFAFIGFEVIANEAGETKTPASTVPKALILAIGISLVLYTLTAIAFTSLASYDQIVSFTQSKVGPLSSAAGNVAGPGLLIILSIIALFSTGNTVLLSLTNASRMLYGMSFKKALPGVFKQTINATPVKAVLFAAIVSFVLLFVGNIETAANATVLGMLLVFTLDNLSVIKLRFSQPNAKRPFKLPLNIGKVPITAVLGVLSCIGLFVYSVFQLPSAFLIFLAMIALGIILHNVETSSLFKKLKKVK